MPRPPSVWDHFDNITRDNAGKYFEELQRLEQTGIETLILRGPAVLGRGSAASEPASLLAAAASVSQGASEPTMLLAAVHRFVTNPLMLDLTLQLMGRLDATAHERVLRKTDDAGTTALIDACRLSPPSEELVRRLLASGAAAIVNASDATGGTALMAAASQPFAAGVRLLLGSHATIDAFDAAGHTALWHACDASAPLPAMVLLSADAAIGLDVLLGVAPKLAAAWLAALLLIALVLWQFGGRFFGERWLSFAAAGSGAASGRRRGARKRRGVRVKEIAGGSFLRGEGEPSPGSMAEEPIEDPPPASTLAISCAPAASSARNGSQVPRSLLLKGMLIPLLLVVANLILFALSQFHPTAGTLWVAAMGCGILSPLLLAASFPNLTTTLRSHHLQIRFSRIGCVIYMAYVTIIARSGEMPKDLLPWLPPPTAAGRPVVVPADCWRALHMLISRLRSGHAVLRLSVWLRLGCLIHHATFELIAFLVRRCPRHHRTPTPSSHAHAIIARHHTIHAPVPSRCAAGSLHRPTPQPPHTHFLNTPPPSLVRPPPLTRPDDSNRHAGDRMDPSALPAVERRARRSSADGAQ